MTTKDKKLQERNRHERRDRDPWPIQKLSGNLRIRLTLSTLLRMRNTNRSHNDSTEPLCFKLNKLHIR